MERRFCGGREELQGPQQNNSDNIVKSRAESKGEELKEEGGGNNKEVGVDETYQASRSPLFNKSTCCGDGGGGSDSALGGGNLFVSFYFIPIVDQSSFSSVNLLDFDLRLP